MFLQKLWGRIRPPAKLSIPNSDSASTPGQAVGDKPGKSGNVLHLPTSVDAGVRLSYNIQIAPPVRQQNAVQKTSEEQITSLMQKAVASHQAGQLSVAQRVYEEILAIQSDHAGSLNMLGVVTHQLGNSQRAIELLTAAISVKPGYVSALSNLGNIFVDVGRYDDAVQIFSVALQSKPHAPELYVNLGFALHQLNQLDASVRSYEKAIALHPQSIEAHNNCGNALTALKQLDAALACYDKALEIDPNYIDAYLNRAGVLQEMLRFDAAVSSLTTALNLKPGLGQVWGQLGQLRKRQNQLTEALECFQNAIKIGPVDAGLHHHCGVALAELHRYEEALEQFDLALAYQPDAADIYCSKSAACHGATRYLEAIEASMAAIALSPKMAQAWLNLGNAQRSLDRCDAALESYKNAVANQPDFVDGHNNLGDFLRELGQYDLALASFERVLDLNANYPFLLGLYLHTAMQICDWERYQKHFPCLYGRIQSGECVTLPFPALGLIDSVSMQQRVSQLWVAQKAPQKQLLEWVGKRTRSDRIKIGYFSADFHTHATSYLMAELFELHDRERFELIAFSFGPDQQDEMRARLVTAFDQFIDVRTLSDIAVAQLSRDLQVDIAVDLKGFTADNRVGIFAYRAAPIQVNYLGYPGTMGADYIDYIIGDGVLIPNEARSGYSEKIVYLPNSYQVNDSKRLISDKTFTRAELGLPDEAFVFCCFNNNYKITPEWFDGWIRILMRVPGSVLWLLEDNPIASRNLRQEAVKRGLDANRLVFAKRLNLAEHLSRHRAADLFIDTLPCNAHTTASDALWAGLPVLTQAGDAFAGRVAASLLHAIGLPELIAGSQFEYEEQAVLLATQPDRLAKIKISLAANLKASPLFDAHKYTGHLEQAYSRMYERYHADLPPDHLFVLS